ncbi:MAG TPA: holo-ACP synthase [Candidatus Limnocylindria bacterium]|nr:holo-ACP synthase [Candidatus Limnocylindria bacterium]
MLAGVGVDLCEIARIERVLQAPSGRRFRARVFTPAEVRHCEGRGRAGAQSYAGIFAAKEAALKALGTGWSAGLAWRHVEVVHDRAGAPALALHGAARTLARRRGVTAAHLTISHAGALAVAVVVLERAAEGAAGTRPPRSRRRSR